MKSENSIDIEHDKRSLERNLHRYSDVTELIGYKLQDREDFPNVCLFDESDHRQPCVILENTDDEGLLAPNSGFLEVTDSLEDSLCQRSISDCDEVTFE